MTTIPTYPLKAIHGAILGGMLMFFAIVMVAPVRGAASVPMLRWAWIGVTVAAVFAVGFVRGRLPPGAGPERVRTAGLLVWAMAEGSALFGIVCTLVTGDIVPAVGATLTGTFLLVAHRPSTLA